MVSLFLLLVTELVWAELKDATMAIQMTEMDVVAAASLKLVGLAAGALRVPSQSALG